MAMSAARFVRVTPGPRPRLLHNTDTEGNENNTPNRANISIVTCFLLFYIDSPRQQLEPEAEP